MPDWGNIARRRQATTAPDQPNGGIWAGRRTPVEATPEDDFETEPVPRTGVRTLGYEPPEEEGLSAGQQFGVGGALAGGGLLLAGLLRRNPGKAMEGLRKVGGALNTARYTSMLSGLAPIKSAMGNIGAPLIEAAERGQLSLRGDPGPIMRAFVNRETLRDWLTAIRNPDVAATAHGLEPGIASRVNLPGRIMGAGDYATQRALQRGGLTSKEANRATLMAPLHENYGPELAKTLDSPLAELLIPFRRVPFNQFAEGLKTLRPSYEHKRVTAGAAGAGAIAGAVTADQEYPAFPAMVAAFAGRYGLPVALAAALVRFQMGKTGGGIPGSILPVSEYGFEETLKNPLRPLDPSYWGIVRAHRRLFEGR